MAWRVWSKSCCGQKWILLLSPLFLLFLTISMMTITLPLPLPPADIDRRSSRALNSAEEFRSRPRLLEPPPAAAFQQPLSHIHSGVWRTGAGKETSKHSVLPKPFREAAGDDKNNIKKSRNTHKCKGIACKRKETVGAIKQTSHRHLPAFTVNNTKPKHRIKPSNHSAVVRHAAQAYIHLERDKSTAEHIPAPADTIISEKKSVDRQAGRWGDRQIHGIYTSAKLAGYHQALEKHRQTTKQSGKSDKVSKERQAPNKSPGDLKKRHNPSEDPSEVGKNSASLDRGGALSEPQTGVTRDGSEWCQSFREQDFPDSDHRRIRISADLQALPWLSLDDIQKMELLAGGEVASKARVPAHGQVLQVALDPPAHPQHTSAQGHAASHSERCKQGHCSLIKRTEDWFEVFAFHLDRVLGINRSLPAVLRSFHSDILPYRYTSGIPRPAVWWDPGIQHLADKDNDQNSVPLSWDQYQKLLEARCGRSSDLRSAPCVGVQHSEWGRLALFDFLLQVNDRLDRYCCGFTPDPTELCVENLLNARCGHTKDLLLVHILVRKTDPSRLVFIDNAGRPQQTTDNLNFRLVEGIDEFPEKAVSVLHSGCLESLLLRSLYTDREFWDSRGGASGLRPLIRTVEQRGQILLQHIRDKKLRLKGDL
ncbi:Golgi-associated kinase 1A isoform X2 [Mugil cephalus]|uniref:Golgi-associated kinase 1A isoform X2 n=1 Tax=Mugil cephalus TaxID=48193 RepID=UPI001FB73814|nr:Golgi-associated kinase 1A isoform X2 [Mugil cephalus]